MDDQQRQSEVYLDNGCTYTRHRRADPRIEARIELPRFPSLDVVAGALGGRTRVERIPTPGDCADGFFEAFWNRPEQLLDDDVRASQSMWRLLPPGAEERIVARLRADLESGAWDAEHGHMRELSEYDGALCLVVSEPD